MRSPFDRSHSAGRSWLGALVVAALVAVLALLGSGLSFHAPSARATLADGLSFDLSCSPEAAVGGPVAFQYTVKNTGTDPLTLGSVIDDRFGDISASFPAVLNPGGSAQVIKYWFVLASEVPSFTNSATATYDPAPSHKDSCTVKVPHLKLTKTAVLNADGTTTFTFVITNDGGTPLHRFSVTDDVLGDLTNEFPLDLAVGESVKVVITRKVTECKNTVTATYQSVPLGTRVDAAAKCTPPEKGSITLTKFKEVGVFTKPVEVCFRLDFWNGASFVPSPDALPSAEQCKDISSGSATFTWTNLPIGKYQVVETKEVCTVKSVVQNPCLVYDPLPAIPVEVTAGNLHVVLPDQKNPLRPGQLCVKKLDKDGNSWPGPDVPFTIKSLTDPLGFTPIAVAIPKDGNPVCKSVPEGTYEVCETVPLGFVVEPSACQKVDVLAGSTVTVTFKNVPKDGARLAPTQTDCQDYRDNPDLAENNLLAVQYDIRTGKISNAVPGVFFYFTQVTIASTVGTADEVSIQQSSSIGAWKEFAIKFVRVWDPKASPALCVKLFEVAACATKTDCTFQLGLTGTFIIQVQYDSKSIIGSSPITCVGGTPTSVSTYTWVTKVDGVQKQSDSLKVEPKPGAVC